MKIIKDTFNRKGKRVVTIELDTNEQILAVRENSYYRTGYPCEEVVGSHILLDSQQVTWCSLGQEWVS